MEDARFAAAVAAAMQDVGGKGIGTMREKTLHLALKYFFAPDAECHEKTIGAFIADAVTEDGVFEIQTRGFANLRTKLAAFLEVCPVTVVHPIANPKWLYTVDENGVLLSKRKSPKHETIFTAMRELYTLRELITNPRLRICFVYVETAEYRLKSSRRGKRGEKLDRVPLSLLGVEHYASPQDYLRLLPEGLPMPFSVKQAADLLRADENAVRMLLSLLMRLDVTEKAGKSGNATLWRVREGFV